jgi:putative ABC transport system permease protein
MTAQSPSMIPLGGVSQSNAHATNSFSPARLGRTLRMALRSLWLHRLRSLLTVLGIVFGVCSVIAMLAIGEGASFEAQEQIKNQSYVLQYGLTYTDIQRIRSTIPGVTVIVPSRIMRDYVWNISRRVDCEITGTVPWYPEMRNHHVSSGRFFNEADMDGSASVCVLGAEMVKTLFPLDSPLGRDVRVGGDYYRVIGVMEPRSKVVKTEEGTGGQGAANQMFIPLETAKTRYGEVLVKQRSGSIEAENVQLHEVTVKVQSRDQVVPVADAIKAVLTHHHKKKDYDVIVPLELLKRAERTKQIFNIVLGSIAAISLLVGGHRHHEHHARNRY